MVHNKWKNIDTFIFDVDGVFTNSLLLVTEEGQFLRSMNVRDGMALKMAARLGYKIAIITKGNSIGVKNRLLALGAEVVYDAVHDKADILDRLIKEHGYDTHSSLYMGDDLPDLAVFDKVLLATAPSDAVSEVLDRAEYISPIKGGHGAVRDVISKVLKSRGHWPIL